MTMHLYKRAWHDEVKPCCLCPDAQQNNSSANTTVTLNIACPHIAHAREIYGQLW